MMINEAMPFHLLMDFVEFEKLSVHDFRTSTEQEPYVVITFTSMFNCHCNKSIWSLQVFTLMILFN